MRRCRSTSGPNTLYKHGPCLKQFPRLNSAKFGGGHVRSCSGHSPPGELMHASANDLVLLEVTCTSPVLAVGGGRKTGGPSSLHAFRGEFARDGEGRLSDSGVPAFADAAAAAEIVGLVKLGSTSSGAKSLSSLPLYVLVKLHLLIAPRGGSVLLEFARRLLGGERFLVDRDRATPSFSASSVEGNCPCVGEGGRGGEGGRTFRAETLRANASVRDRGGNDCGNLSDWEREIAP